MKLRQYQTDTIDSLRSKLSKGLKRLVMCAPTGAGKTVMFSYMLSKALEKNKKCMVLTHRTELLTQAGGVLSRLNKEVVNLDAKLKKVPTNELMYVAMTQTLIRRLKKVEYLEILQNLDLLIIDEAHLQNFNSILLFINPATIVIGVTATPLRTSNQDSLNDFYEDIVEEITISELIENKFLSKPVTYGFKLDLKKIKVKGGDYDSESLGDFMTKNKIFQGVYENYNKITPNKKALIFSPNVKSSQKLVSELCLKGLNAKHIDATIKEKERKEILQWFKNTPNALLSNVGILTAGYDEASIEVVILYRATKSLSLFLQMVGRGSRTTNTKKEFTILDFGNNVYTHGLWEQERIWNLQKEVKEKGVAPIKNCTNCDAILPASANFCEYCGAELPKTLKEKEEALKIELSKITKEDISTFMKVKNFEKLEQYAIFKGYKKSWLHYKIKLEDLQDYAIYKGYDLRWLERIKNLRNGK